jgi:hypothetical protein
MKLKNFPNNKEKYYNSLKTLLNKLDHGLPSTSTTESESNKMENLITNNPDISEKENAKCSTCQKNDFKYICPKCKIKYCSVECYKQHNVDCTESFYKNQVEEDLKSTKVSEEEGKQFRRTLKDYYGRLQKDNSDFDISLTDEKKKHLEDLLNKIENNTIDFGKDLTPEDWEDFNKFI